MKKDNDIVPGAFLYKPGITYTQGDIVSHDGVLYVTMAEETTSEPQFGSPEYQEYAYNKAVKDPGSVMDEQSKFHIVAGEVVEKILSDALGNIREDQLEGKIGKMQTLSRYESLSYTLTDKVEWLSGRTSFSFTPISELSITELDVFVTFAPLDIPQDPENLIYMQEMGRCVLTDRRQVYAKDSEYMDFSISLSNGSYIVTVTPYPMSVMPQSLQITRIEGVGTIISGPTQN